MNNKYLILSFLFLIGCSDDIMGTDTSSKDCGNGIKNIGEECDGEDNCNNCTLDRRIFITDDSFYPSNLFTDLWCEQITSNTELDRGLEWETWLTLSTFGIADYVYQSEYKYILLNGTIVANSFQDLIDGTLIRPINITDSLKLINNALVWTGTDEFGKFAGNSCEDWDWTPEDQDEHFGNYGISSSVQKGWTNYGFANCNQKMHIYCIESHPRNELLDVNINITK